MTRKGVRGACIVMVPLILHRGTHWQRRAVPTPATIFSVYSALTLPSLESRLMPELVSLNVDSFRIHDFLATKASHFSLSFLVVIICSR